MCCSSCISLNSVQSFVIENCNGSTIENGLNNLCLHPLSRNFTFIVAVKRTFCAPLERPRATHKVEKLRTTNNYQSLVCLLYVKMLNAHSDILQDAS